MKKLSLFSLVLVLSVGYYVAWPMWSAYELHNAIKTKDLVSLAHKIDFPSVRASLRVAAVEKLAELHDRADSAAAGTLPTQRITKEDTRRVVDRMLEGTATPDGLLRIIGEDGPLRASVERLLRDHMDRAGEGATPIAGTGTTAAGKSSPLVRTVGTEMPKERSSYGFANIKSIRPASPFRFEIGIAKDQVATRPDIFVDFGFTGTDWKITGVRLAA
jgi:hypothetical protein